MLQEISSGFVETEMLKPHRAMFSNIKVEKKDFFFIEAFYKVGENDIYRFLNLKILLKLLLIYSQLRSMLRFNFIFVYNIQYITSYLKILFQINEVILRPIDEEM